MSSDVLQAMTGLQEALLKTDGIEQFLHELAVLAVRTVGGEASCCALPLFSDGKPSGALVLYSRRPEAFGPRESGHAQEFARYASGALTLALRMAACIDQNDQLRSSIVSRAVIDQALGVIMATERCSPGKAFAMLRSVPQNTNVKLRDLAADIVTERERRAAHAHGTV